MTGGTILILNKSTWTYSNVAHDGFDLEEKLNLFNNWMNNNLSPKEILIEYFKSRNSGDFEIYDIDPIHLIDQCCFELESSAIKPIIALNLILDNIIDIV